MNLDILNAFTGHFSVQDADGRYVLVNKNAANQGFNKKHPEDVIGLTYDNLHGRLIELADSFKSEASWVMSHKKSIKTLSMNCFDANDWRFFLGEKNPIIENGEVTGILLIHNDISDTSIMASCLMHLSSTDSFASAKNKTQRSCVIQKTYQDFNLTVRESECLFYLVRGKTYVQIGTILSLSTRTVESYVDSIKSKLNCHTKSELIEKALHLNAKDVILESVLTHRIN